MLSEDYPDVKVPLELKQEVDSRANHLSKPAADTSLYRLLINTMLPNEVEWTSDEMVKKHKHLIFACQGTFLID